MKKIITVYENKKNMKKFELIPEIEMDGKACLRDMETGEEKFYAQSTLKKNFFKEEVEKRSEGRIGVTIYPNSQLGTEVEQIQSALTGGDVKTLLDELQAKIAG